LIRFRQCHEARVTVAVPSELLPEKTGFDWLAVDALSNTYSLQALQIWRRIRGQRRFPSRHDLKPRDIAPIMEHMSVIKVIDGGADYENRFVGDSVVRVHGIPIAGRRFSEIANDAPVLVKRLLPVAGKTVATGAPVAYCGKTGHDMQQVIYTDFEGVMLPLGETDATVDHILYAGICTVHLVPC
jgi:hypothetical protein